MNLKCVMKYIQASYSLSIQIYFQFIQDVST